MAMPSRVRCPHFWFFLLLCEGVARLAGAAEPLLEATARTVTAESIRRHIEFLASDTLEGREGGTQGGYAAAAYLVDQLQRSGIKAAADGDYYQYFSPNFRNIVAALPGSDPVLKDEYVLVGAHYDHVGYGAPGNSRGPIGVIHNGADDNASGAAGVLEVARALAQLKPGLKRSVLVVFWDAEEKGLLGSKHFVQSPVIPLAKIKLHFNADMIGRLRPGSLEVSGWRTAPGLRQFLAVQNLDRLDLDLTLAYRPDSDHWPLFERGVPSVMLHTGRHDDYHRPSDDPPAINLSGAEQVSRYLFRVLVAAGNADSLPTFRRESLNEGGTLEDALRRLAISSRPPSRLGVGFDVKLSEQRIVKVTRVEADSPAATAGVQPGDEILALGGRAVKDVADFRTLVAITPNQTQATLRRGDEERTVALELRGEPMRLGLLWHLSDVEPDVAVVSAVVAGSPAESAGLKPGHRILKAEGAPVRDAAAFRKLLAEGSEPVTLDVEFNGRIEQMRLPRLTDAVAGP